MVTTAVLLIRDKQKDIFVCSIKMYVDTLSAEVHDAFLSYHNFCFYEVLEKKQKQKKLDHCISSECNALALSVTFKVQWQTCPFGAS